MFLSQSSFYFRGSGVCAPRISAPVHSRCRMTHLDTPRFPHYTASSGAAGHRILPVPTPESGGQRMKRAGICLLLSLVFFLTLLSGCGSKSAQPGMTTDVRDGITIHNGTEQLFYQVGNGQRGELRFHFKGETGSISACVYMKGYPDYPYYRGQNIPPSNFTVVLLDPGEYIVDIEAVDYAGDYTIDWSRR